MKIVVCDSNIFIDLLQTDLLPAYLNLGYENHAPPGVVGEVREQNRQMLIDAIETGQILIPIIENLDEIGKLKNQYSPLSFQDCACLFMAIKLNAMLLTGEKPLKRVAEEKYSLEVHGTLYIFDELLEAELITFHMAHKKLSRLIANGTYLPSNECQKRLKRWIRRFK